VIYKPQKTLAGKTIGVVPGSLGAQAIALLDVDVTTVTVSDREAALDALDAGELDAIAGDTLLLAGAILPRNFDQYQLAPVEPLTRYGIACMVPENNSGFLDTVNFALVKLMEGYVSGEPESVATLDRWFGDQGLIRIPSTVIENFFRSIILTREQVYLGDD
jgi:polar amino acid transport system substrate-binding protein